MKNDVICLVTVSRTQGTGGFYQESYVRREIFAEIKSATRTEVYTANRAGVNAKLIAVVNEDDYQMAVSQGSSSEYQARTVDIYGEETEGTVTLRTVLEPEYVEYGSVRYKIERTYRPPGSTDRELTLSMME